MLVYCLSEFGAPRLDNFVVLFFVIENVTGCSEEIGLILQELHYSLHSIAALVAMSLFVLGIFMDLASSLSQIVCSLSVEGRPVLEKVVFSAWCLDKIYLVDL